MAPKKRTPLRGAHRIKKLVPGLDAKFKGGVVNFDTGWIARRATAEELESFNESPPGSTEPLSPDGSQVAGSAQVLPLRPRADRPRRARVD